ncbi:MAG: hypothetical protein AABY22_11645 [Nanoarchaeota archaeon]
MGKKLWIYEKGIRILRFKKKKRTYGNYSKSLYYLDVQNSVIISPELNLKYYRLYLSIRTAKEYVEFIKMVINNFFDGTNGNYSILGRYDTEKASKHLWNVPIAKIGYEKDSLYFIELKTRRQRWGRNKTSSKTYKLFTIFPELKSYI